MSDEGQSKEGQKDFKEVEAGEHGFIGKPIATYLVVFDTAEQLWEFGSFIRRLRAAYPNHGTIGSRLSAYIADNPIRKKDEWHDTSEPSCCSKRSCEEA